MDSLIKVRNQPTFFRDPHTKAIVVVDDTGLKTYNNQKTIAQQSQKNAKELQEEVNALKEDISAIKSMLQDIASFINHK